MTTTSSELQPCACRDAPRQRLPQLKRQTSYPAGIRIISRPGADWLSVAGMALPTFVVGPSVADGARGAMLGRHSRRALRRAPRRSRQVSYEREAVKPDSTSDPGAIVHYAPSMSPPATLLMWFQLRSPELAEDFERLTAWDRDIVRGSLDTCRIGIWRDRQTCPDSRSVKPITCSLRRSSKWAALSNRAANRSNAWPTTWSISSRARGMLVVRPVL
jgi:hypothetical protein